jgi:hypothetical protein
MSDRAETEKLAAKLIQICASQNDLFGLDDDGIVYHYNFNTDSWMKLGRERRSDAASPPAAPGGPRAPHHQVEAAQSSRRQAS